MKLYNARVRLKGSISNEVNKKKLTAAEIIVLQRMHGDDAVQAIVEIGNVQNRSDAKERARLTATYTKGPGPDGKRIEGPAFIASIFGPGQPLPKEYVAAPIVEEEEIEDVQVEEPEVEALADKPVPVRRAFVPRKAAKADDAAAALTG